MDDQENASSQGRYADRRPNSNEKKIDGVPIMTCTKCSSTFFQAVVFQQLRADNMVAPDRAAMALSTLVRYKCAKCGLVQDHPRLSISDDAVRKTHDIYSREQLGTSDPEVPFMEKWKEGLDSYTSQEDIVKARLEQDLIDKNS